MRILIAERLDVNMLMRLMDAFGYDSIVVAHKGSERFDMELQHAHVLVIADNVKVNKELLDLAPHLMIIVRISGESNNIDISACKERSIETICAPPVDITSTITKLRNSADAFGIRAGSLRTAVTRRPDKHTPQARPARYIAT